MQNVYLYALWGLLAYNPNLVYDNFSQKIMHGEVFFDNFALILKTTHCYGVNELLANSKLDYPETFLCAWGFRKNYRTRVRIMEFICNKQTIILNMNKEGFKI